MDNKCSKYEGLFVFSDTETLQQHVLECEECRKEQETMDKVSDLLSEVKLHYRSKNKKKPILKAVCGLMLLLFFAGSYEFASNYDDMLDSIKYGDTLSAEELGFPVDSYGLIAVDE